MERGRLGTGGRSRRASAGLLSPANTGLHRPSRLMYVEKQCEQVKVSETRWRRWESERRGRPGGGGGAGAVPPDRVSFQLRSTGCLRGTHNQTIPWNLRVLFPSRSRRPGAPRDRAADKAPNISANSC